MKTNFTMHVSLPTLFFIIFLFMANLAAGLYLGLAIVPSPAFRLLYSLSFLWIMGWWLMEDGRNYELKWPYGWGFFLYLAMWFMTPYYLFKTRGLRAFVTIAAFTGVYIGTYMVGIMAGITFRLLTQI